MADLYENWCREKRAENGRKTLWRLIEHEGVRDDVLEELSGRVLHHYVSDEDIAVFIEVLGYPKAADSIRGLLPQTTNGRSGDLGEILAVEFVEERLDYKVPVRKLRYKDHRDMAMRGEDVIAVTYDDRDRLKLLKGEAKSAEKLSKPTVKEARAKLESDHGRPSAHSLVFIARRLVQSKDPERRNLGKDILKESVNREVPKNRLGHLLFTFSGNPGSKIIRNDLESADGGREQHSVNLRIKDHREFIDTVYKGALSIGDG